MGVFENIVMTMSDAGMNLFLPWLLILSVTYGLLNKYEVISDEPQVNGVTSLAFSFLVMIGVSNFAPPQMWSHLAANIAFGTFGLVGLLILLGVSGYDLSEMGNQWSLPWIFAGTIGVVSFLGILVQYGGGGGALIGPGENLFDQVVMPILTLIFLLVVVIMTTVAGD